MACWKALFVCFLGQLEFLDVGSIFPLKNHFSQDCFLWVQKVAKRALFWCFFSLLETENLPKILSHLWACIFFHTDSKYVRHFSRIFLHQNRSTSGATHLLEKPVLKISMRSTIDFVCSAIVRLSFRGLPGVQIGCKIARWKYYWVYFPTQLQFLNLEFIFPIKSPISQDWSKCVEWDCQNAYCCCSQPLKVFLNSKLSSW